MYKKIIIGGFVLLGIALIIVAVAVIVQPKQVVSTPRKLSVQPNSISFFDGVFISFENNILHIRNSSGSPSDFYINDVTQVFRAQAQGAPEKIKITDIPQNALVQVSVQDNSPSNMTADTIVYRDGVQ